MTDKEAIEIANSIVKVNEDYLKGVERQTINQTEIQAISIVLHLLETKNAEIEYWKSGFERELEDNRENTCELLKQDLIIRKKDKIIDEMASFIYELYKSRPMTIDKAFSHNLCLWEDCDDINREVNCDYCIKEYFKKKVEEK